MRFNSFIFCDYRDIKSSIEIYITKSQLLSVVKVRCIGLLSPTRLLYIVFG